jgi:hypothetical protein
MGTAGAIHDREANSRGGRRAKSVLPIVRPDHRTKVGRRVLELERLFKAAIGEVSPVMQMKITDAVTLKVLAEIARMEFLSGRPIRISHLVRLEHRAELAMQRLRLDEQGSTAAPETLEQHLAAMVRRRELATAAPPGEAPGEVAGPLS